LLGLYLCSRKPRLVTSRSRLCLVVVTKALAIARLLVVASWARSQCFLHPPPCSVGLHRTATGAGTLLPHHAPPMVVLLLVYTQSWYCTTSMPGVQHLGWMLFAAPPYVHSYKCRLRSPTGFPYYVITLLSPPGPVHPLQTNHLFCVKVSLRKGLVHSPVCLYELFPYMSGVYHHRC